MNLPSHRTNALAAALLLVLLCGGLVWLEITCLLEARRQTRLLGERALPAAGQNRLLQARFQYLHQNRTQLEALWRQLHSSQFQQALSPAQLRPLTELQIGTKRLTNDYGLERKTVFGFSGNHSEFHRVLPALAEWENSLPLVQVHRLSLTLPLSQTPLSRQATYLEMEGVFSLPNLPAK